MLKRIVPVVQDCQHCLAEFANFHEHQCELSLRVLLENELRLPNWNTCKECGNGFNQDFQANFIWYTYFSIYAKANSTCRERLSWLSFRKEYQFFWQKSQISWSINL